MRIYSGTSSKSLSERIFNAIGRQLKQTRESFDSLKILRFSDGEISVRFEDSLSNEPVFFIQTINSSDSVVESLLVADAARRSGAKSFTLVAPYLGYSRQDKLDTPNSSLGARVLANTFENAGIGRLISIDIHSRLTESFYKIPIVNLNSGEMFTEHLKGIGMNDLMFLSPDEGSITRTSSFASNFPGSSVASIKKKRVRPNEVHSMELSGNVSGKNVVILDDIADTLGTLKKASDLAKEHGARSILAFATHGVLSGRAIENLENSSLEQLIVSDTIETQVVNRKLRQVSCQNIISKEILRLLRDPKT